ncbi:MAG: pyridoxal-dependent decarboxylase [Bacteroidota bacterium]
MDKEEFRAWGYKMVDWIADYQDRITEYPVLSQVKPGDIKAQIPHSPPADPESMEEIWQDVEQVILPGITHWQNPRFFAYFQANTSYPSMLAEMLSSGLGAQCMIWATSPAAAELEERMMNWLIELSGLPADWEGVIQPTGSDSTLVALLSAREKVTDFHINQAGFNGVSRMRVYATAETHSSIEKAAKIAGIGRENCLKIPTDSAGGMLPMALQEQIQADRAAGFIPLAVTVTIGTTGRHAIDPLEPIAEVCEQENVWLHVDGAHAGTALLLPELQHYLKGIEKADSYYFNPHKWMFTHFDCSAYFVKDPQTLIKTFSILPEYLKTQADQEVNNYRDWGIPLGRRFRALKLWFVMRRFGSKQLREKIRSHLALTAELVREIEAHPQFEMLNEPAFNLICFRLKPKGLSSVVDINKLNEQFMHALNHEGQIFLSHTLIEGQYALRLSIGQTYLSQDILDESWAHIQSTAQELLTAHF